MGFVGGLKKVRHVDTEELQRETELTAIDKTIDRHHLKLLTDTDWKFLY